MSLQVSPLTFFKPNYTAQDKKRELGATMINYIIRRILLALLVILLVSFSIFVLVRMLPGDPIEMKLSQNMMVEMTPEMLATARHELGLDRPIIIQYVDWVGNLLRGDFGNSILHHYDIGRELGNRVVVSLLIGVPAFILALILGPLLGTISAIRRGKPIDTIVTAIANIGITAPTFWIGILLIIVLGVRLDLLPNFGYTLPWVDFGRSVRQSIMPVFVTALAPIAMATRQARASVLETLGVDYIRTAWAKGLNERKVIIRHVMKNSMLPVVTMMGTMFRILIGNAVIVETVFVIPGMGSLLVSSVLAHDYPVVQAIIVVMTTIVVLSSLIVDLIQGWLDPRIQYE